MNTRFSEPLCHLDPATFTVRPAAREKASVFIIDDQALVREWFSGLINRQSDLELCGGASDTLEAAELIRELQPNVVVTELTLDGGSAIQLIKDLKISAPDIAVVVLSMHDEPQYAERAFRAGARGYVMKREATKVVLEAIRTVLDGKPYMSDKTVATMAERLDGGELTDSGSRIDLLSNREFEVFQLLGCGRTSRQIAQEMSISFRTVQAFCARLKVKLKVKDGTELLLEAGRWHSAQHP
jgi:DNA-binding NarL/FixJ family response regulator